MIIVPRYLVASAAICLALAHQALAITIEDFSSPSVAIDSPGAGPTSDGGAVATGPFATRTLTATSSGTGSLAIRVGLGVVAIEPGFETTGNASVLFSGGGPVDFSGAQTLALDFLGADFAGADVFLEIIDSSLESSGLLDFTGGATLGTAPVELSMPIANVPASVDMANVSSLRVLFSLGAHGGNDLAFDNLRLSSVPEPLPLPMLGLGLLALSSLVHRHRGKRNPDTR